MSTSGAMERFFFFGFGVMSLFSLWRCVITPSPIYESDEYAYLASALTQDTQDRVQNFKKDPMLQQINDPIYNEVLRKAILFGKDPAPFIRFLNWVLFYGGIGLMGFLFLKEGGNNLPSYIFIFLLGLLPSGVSILSIMPDIFLASIFSILAISYISSNQWRLVNTICAAIVLSLLAYVKPHAISLIAGFMLYLCWKAVDSAQERKKNCLMLGLFGVTVLLSIACINKHYYDHFTLQPLFIGGVYKSFVNNGSALKATSSSLIVLKQVVWYALGYISSIVFLFPLAVYSLAVAKFKKSEACNRKIREFAFFSFFSTLTLSGMAALYGWHVSEQGLDGESLRIWGRYLLPVLPLWALLSASASQSKAHFDKDKRRAFIIAACGMIAGITYILYNKFKLYPWDYPELFCLFSPKNDYWHFSFIPHLREIILMFIAAIIVGGFIGNTQWQLRLLILAQVGIFIAAFGCTFLWQSDHAQEGNIFKISAESCGFILPKAANVLIVTNARYGVGSRVAYGLHRKPWIIELGEDNEITEQTLPDAIDCLITTTAYKVKLAYNYQLQVGALNVYILNEKGNILFAKKGNPKNESLN